MPHACCCNCFWKTKRSNNYFSLRNVENFLFFGWTHKIFRNFPRGTYRLLLSMFCFDVVFFIFRFINGWISLEAIYTPTSKQYVIEHENEKLVSEYVFCISFARPLRQHINNSWALPTPQSRMNKIISGDCPVRCLPGVNTSS